MKKEKLGKKLGALALTGIIASATILPCTVNATEVVKEDNNKIVGRESVDKKGKKQGKKMRAKEQNSGDTTNEKERKPKKSEEKVKYKNLTDEEKEDLKIEHNRKRAKSKKYDKN